MRTIEGEMKLTRDEVKTTLDTQGAAEGAHVAPRPRLNVIIPLVIVCIVSFALLLYRVIYNVGPRQEVTIGFDYPHQGQFTMPISVRVVGCSSSHVRVDERYYLGLEGGSIQLPEGSFEVMTYAGSVLDDGSLVYAKKTVGVTVGDGMGEEDEETAVEQKLSGEARDVLAKETNAEQAQTKSTTKTTAPSGQGAQISEDDSESDQADETEEGTDASTDTETDAATGDDSAKEDEQDNEGDASDTEVESPSDANADGEAADGVLTEVSEEGVDEAYLSRDTAETIAAESAPLQRHGVASDQVADEAALEGEPQADVVIKLGRRSFGTVSDEGLDLVVSAIKEGGVNEGYDAVAVEDAMRRANDVQLVEGSRWDPLGFKLTLPPYWRGKVAGLGGDQSALVTIGRNYGHELLSTKSFVIEAQQVEEAVEDSEEDASEQAGGDTTSTTSEERVRVDWEDKDAADADSAGAQDTDVQDGIAAQDEVEEEPVAEIVWEPTGIPELDAEPWAIYWTARGIKVDLITIDGVTAARMNMLLDTEDYDGYLVIYLTDYLRAESDGDTHAYLADLQRLGREGRTSEVALCSVLDFLTRDHIEYVDGELVEVVPEQTAEESTE